MIFSSNKDPNKSNECLKLLFKDEDSSRNFDFLMNREEVGKKDLFKKLTSKTKKMIPKGRTRRGTTFFYNLCYTELTF